MLVRLIAALLLLVPPGAAQDDPEAERDLLRQALTMLAEQPMSEAMVTTYEDLHGRAWRLGDAETAHAAIDRIVDWREDQYGPDATNFATSLNNLANLLKALGDHAAARPLHERSLAIREAAHGPDHPRVATSLNNLAALLSDLGDDAAARPLYERSLAISEAAYGPGHPDVAASLTNLALLLSDLGDNGGARPLFERALAIREAAYGPEHPDVATSLNNLAVLLWDLGDYAAAQPLFERALVIREAVYGPEHPDVASSLNNLAALLTALRNHAGARPLQERSLAIQEAALGPGHPDVASSLNNLAALLRDLGDFAAARPLQERALAISEAAQGPGHPDVADSLHNLANLLRDLGDHGAARPLYERSLAIREAALGPEHPDVASSLNNLATLFRDLGDFAAARPLYERSLAISEAALGPGHPDVADSLHNLANLLKDLGDHAGARPLYERALAIYEVAYGSEHPFVATSLNALAHLHLDTGEAEVAHRYALRVVGRREQLRRTLASLTTGESYLFLAGQRESGHTLLATAQAVEEPAAAYATVLDSKGQVARLTLQTRAQIREALGPEMLALTEALGSLQARFSRLALETDVRDREAHEGLLESLRAERDAIDRELRRRVPLIESAAALPAAVAASLPERSAIVDLLVHPAYVPARFEGGACVEVGRWSDPRVSAWILRSGQESVAHVDLGSLAEIGAALREHLRAVVADGATRGVAMQGQPDEAPVATDLYRRIWEPLTPYLGDATTVFLSPDEVLGTLPFETLQDDDGRYLIEDHALVYLSSGGDLLELGSGGERLQDATLLAIGGVDYDRRSALGDDEGAVSSSTIARSRGEPAGAFDGGWRPLPGTVVESRSILDSHQQTQGTVGRMAFWGPEATEERLKAEMPRHAILHLATHGFFQPDGLPSMWEAARDAVSGERGMQMTESAARLTGLHPGLLTGLVLAGANRPPEDDAADPDAPVRDDGYLTASEVTLLDLSNTDLVVLSACETGLGRPQSGEGLLGLRRAFHMAGAKTVISSLWSVKDESTSELMQSFYANLFVRGMGRHEALRAAQLAMLNKNRLEHGEALPSTWGAFVLSGEWR